MSNMTAVKIRTEVYVRDKLRRCADACGLSRSEFVRQLLSDRMPQPKPPKEFWMMLEQLYSLHGSYQRLAQYSPVFTEICGEVEQLVIDLQAEFTLPKPVVWDEILGKGVV